MRLFAEGIERVQALTDFGHYGGAPILGFDRVFIKCHARADLTALMKKRLLRYKRAGRVLAVASINRDVANLEAELTKEREA